MKVISLTNQLARTTATGLWHPMVGQQVFTFGTSTKEHHHRLYRAQFAWVQWIVLPQNAKDIIATVDQEWMYMLRVLGL
jgi:hypothetical protein